MRSWNVEIANRELRENPEKKAAEQEIEMEGLGRLQAEQTPQWIVGRERDVRWGGGIGKHTDPPPPAAGCGPRVWPRSPLLSTLAFPYNTTVNASARPGEHTRALLFTLHAMPSL